MSNHATPTDLIAMKVNEIIEHMNHFRHNGMATAIEPLTCFPHLNRSEEPKKEVMYPEYTQTKTDHTTIGA